MPSLQARPFALLRIVSFELIVHVFECYLFGQVLYTHILDACYTGRRACRLRCIRSRRYCTTPISTFIKAHAE
jgi:hypothetical protein